MKRPILSDHKRVGKTLVTPFNQTLKLGGEVSWVNTMIPELLWIKLVHDFCGDRRAVEVITSFTRSVRESEETRDREIWAAAGKFRRIPPRELIEIVPKPVLNELQASLRPMLALYPTSPLNFMLQNEIEEPSDKHLETISFSISELYDRESVTATMTQATAIWLAFDAGVLKVNKGLALAEFPKIEEYPNTNISRKIAASIRAALNGFFAVSGPMASGTEWPTEFWNRGLEISCCELDNG